ncbi:hypothetical protein [Kalamiella sp. sgz302252]|uniref:hypothetical protein n=1 Tax=Pantoea sp. sgz302252 TaxID=3341827 RepID=UPI0036D41AB8
MKKWAKDNQQKQKNRRNGGSFVLARLAALPAGLRYKTNASASRNRHFELLDIKSQVPTAIN